jgi:hypothetical protein
MVSPSSFSPRHSRPERESSSPLSVSLFRKEGLREFLKFPKTKTPSLYGRGGGVEN